MLGLLLFKHAKYDFGDYSDWLATDSADCTASP